MRKIIFLFLILCNSILYAQYTPDELGISFGKHTIQMPNDYEGKVICTLVKYLPKVATTKSVLYVHGYNDYFFQTELAERFAKAGYRFYAVDLRKCGRSLLSNQVATNAHDLHEYDADIDSSMAIIRKEGATKLILIGHSMGGLITSLYAESKGANLKVDGMILNAPFFDFNENGWNEMVAVPAVSFLAKFFPDGIIKAGTSTAYGESIHRSHRGEWNYDLKKKMLASGDKHWCWIAAIHRGQVRVQEGLNIQCPILTFSSDKSIREDIWNIGFQTADGVLDVNDIQKYAQNIGAKSTVMVFPGGMHDLVLSKRNVRDAVYKNMFRWLKLNGL